MSEETVSPPTDNDFLDPWERLEEDEQLEYGGCNECE